ncbi:MAG TPA: hypothetical protein DCP40_11305 [Stenotrophomonas sp.]|nr:hypothetical protein [Stenotrophomonas sp.]
MLLAEQLCKQFGEKTVLWNLDLRVPSGEIVGIIGANGVGKTTLFRILCDLIPVDSGTIDIGSGARMTGAPCADLGYLPESRSLFSDVTVGATLDFWARLRGVPGRSVARVRDLWLAKIGLLDRSSHRVSSLSKGNLQKLQLAACMLHEPGVLILDEPFSGLDPVNQVAVADMLIRASDKGAAVVLSAHHIELLQRLASRILVLREGRLHPATSRDLHPPRADATGQTQHCEPDPHGHRSEGSICG